ncbi:MAG: putative zinc-finger [Armatimonadetes bacterium]|nr:putative zinc-finger [Armatimonadota bacterium]
MTCAEFQDRLSAYMDGELPRWKRWKVQNHLQRCSECASLMSDLDEVDLHLAVGLNAAPAPEYLTSAVMHRLPAMPPAWRRSGTLGTWSAGLAVASMQLLALCGAYWWGYTRSGDLGPNVDRTSIINTPTPPLRPRKSEAIRRQEGSAAPAATGSIWSKPIRGVDPETLRRLQQEPPHSTTKRARTRKGIGTFSPQMQLEGAR